MSAALLALLAVVLLGGESDDGPVPAFSKQITPASRWAVTHYPGTRVLDKQALQRTPGGPNIGVLCDNGIQGFPGKGVPAGGTITCSFFSRDQKTSINEKVHVVTNHPITFAPIGSGDCFEGADAFHKTGPCR